MGMPHLVAIKINDAIKVALASAQKGMHWLSRQKGYDVSRRTRSAKQMQAHLEE
jgi:hypothetical protein